MLEKGRTKKDFPRGEIIERLGFVFGMWSGGPDDCAISLDISCGCYATWIANGVEEGIANSVIITWTGDLGALHDPAKMLRVLEVVVRNWSPDWAGVLHADALESGNYSAKKPLFDCMLYVAGKMPELDRPASLIQLPGQGSIAIAQTPPFIRPPKISV